MAMEHAGCTPAVENAANTAFLMTPGIGVIEPIVSRAIVRLSLTEIASGSSGRDRLLKAELRQSGIRF